jgi:hypothetical protein
MNENGDWAPGGLKKTLFEMRHDIRENRTTINMKGCSTSLMSFKIKSMLVGNKAKMVMIAIQVSSLIVAVIAAENNLMTTIMLFFLLSLPVVFIIGFLVDACEKKRSLTFKCKYCTRLEKGLGYIKRCSFLENKVDAEASCVHVETRNSYS